MSEFLSPEQARERYNLHTLETNAPSEVEQALAEQGIAAIEMPLSAQDFAQLSDGFALVLMSALSY